jgi:hypothetical protein
VVDEQTGRLVRLEMIQEAARVPDVEYRFRNPMTQEIAYQTILLKRRREFHCRVGAALEALFPDRLAELAPKPCVTMTRPWNGPTRATLAANSWSISINVAAGSWS